MVWGFTGTKYGPSTFYPEQLCYGVHPHAGKKENKICNSWPCHLLALGVHLCPSFSPGLFPPVLSRTSDACPTSPIALKRIQWDKTGRQEHFVTWCHSFFLEMINMPLRHWMSPTKVEWLENTNSISSKWKIYGNHGYIDSPLGVF